MSVVVVVTSAQYETDSEGNNKAVKAVIDGKTLSAPMDPANRHYQAILEWVADGNTIQDAD